MVQVVDRGQRRAAQRVEPRVDRTAYAAQDRQEEQRGRCRPDGDAGLGGAADQQPGHRRHRAVDAEQQGGHQPPGDGERQGLVDVVEVVAQHRDRGRHGGEHQGAEADGGADPVRLAPDRDLDEAQQRVERHPDPGQGQPLDLLALGAAGPTEPQPERDRAGREEHQHEHERDQREHLPPERGRTERAVDVAPAAPRNGTSATAPSTWVTTTVTTTAAGTHRHRGDGTRPSGKCSSSSPNVARTHHASSTVTAASQDQRPGSSVVATHCSQTSLAATWATVSERMPSSTPTGAPSRRRATSTDSAVVAGTTTTPIARLSHEVRVGAATRNPTATTRWRAASTAHTTAARRAQAWQHCRDGVAVAGSVPARDPNPEAATIR